jgi:hypothetical protein
MPALLSAPGGNQLGVVFDCVREGRPGEVVQLAQPPLG